MGTGVRDADTAASNAREVQPASVTVDSASAPGLVELLGRGGPAAVLGLQRTAGNRAVTALLQRDVSGASDAMALPGGGEYEYRIDFAVGDRWNGTFRMAISKSNANPLVAKGDVSDPETPHGAVKTQLGAAKTTWTHGKGLASAMTAAILKTDLVAFEPWPGIAVKADFKALETKVEAGDVDVNIFKVGLIAEGILTKALRATSLGEWVEDNSPFGELLLEGASIKVQLRGEVIIDPSDAVRLARMAKLNGQIAKNAAEVVKLNDKIDALRRQSELLKKRGRGKGAKLAKRIAANKAKIASLTKRLTTSKKAGQALLKASQAAAAGIKTKAGRLVGLAVKQVGGRMLMRLVPFVNIALAIADVVTVSKAIYDLATGKARLGLPSGEEGEAGDGGEQHDAASPDAGQDAGGASDGGEHGGGPERAGRSEELPPEIEIDSLLEEPGDAGAPVALEPNAQVIVDQLKVSSPQGAVGLTAEDLAQLNDIARDVTPDELEQILGHITTKSMPVADSFALLAEILRRKRQLRAAAMPTTVEDAEGVHVLVDPSTPVPDSPDVAAGKAKGKSQGPGGKGSKERGPAGPRLSETEPIGDTAPDSPTSLLEFQIVSGYSSDTRYAKGSSFSITAEFEADGGTHRIAFTIKVDERIESGGTTTLKARNVRGWKLKGGTTFMAAGAPVTITSSPAVK